MNTLSSPLVRSINPVVVDAMTGAQAIVYFHCTDFVINEKARFKDQDGRVTFLLHITQLVEKPKADGTVSIEYEPFKTIAQNPKGAEYKLSTFMKKIVPVLFEGIDEENFDVNAYNQRKAQLMIEQIDFNSSFYFGLTADNLMAV